MSLTQIPRQSQLNQASPIANNDDDAFNCTDFMSKLFENVPKPKLQITNNRHIKNAWTAYKPSCQTEKFISEIGRNIFAEAFQTSPTIEYVVEDLRTLTLQCLTKHYHDYKNLKKFILSENDVEYFGENLDIELPVQNLTELQNDNYWRRVAEAKCKDKYEILAASQTDGFLYWKQLGIAAKLAELIENTDPEVWHESNLVEIAKTIKSEVYKLDIRQMKPLCDYSLEQSAYNPRYNIYNYPPENCHHGNLGLVIAELKNLTSLTLKFGNEIEMYSYEKRHFDISYKDIENLSNGLKKLSKLKKLAIHHSFLDDRKLKVLTRGLVNCSFLTDLELSYCHLTNDSGQSIGHFLEQNTTLQRLELRGNEIGPFGCQGIGYGLQQFNGTLDYIGLADNPIHEQGVLNIGGGFCHTHNVRQIDFSRCDVDEMGAYRMAQIVGFHLPLTWIDLCAVPLGENGGKKLVSNLVKHKHILHLECRGCGLTENQERTIKILLERNKYLHDAPIVDKDFITEDDAKEIDDWIKIVKHPILAKVLNRKPTRDSWLKKVSKCDFNAIPSFVPKEQQKICKNSDVPGVDVHGYQSDGSSIEDPNEFDENEIVEHILMGRNIDDSSKIYFE